MQRNRFYRTAQNFLISLGLVIAAASANANEFTNLEKAAKGQTVYFPMLDGQEPIEATITDTVFYDPKGERING